MTATHLIAYRIPFNSQALVGTELAAVAAVLDGERTSGDGPIGQRCEALLEAELGATRALLTPSCTHALELAALVLGIEPGDEVIIPSFTFPSTANAFVLRGARPIFADIRPDTLNLDVDHIESLVTARTKAIAPVHYAGIACEMDPLAEIARRFDLAVVEDNAHGLFGSYRQQPLGTFGTMAALSFHETKNFTCGEGGALLLNDPALVHRAEIIREKGTDRSVFERGEVELYTWREPGSSYVLSEILAAVLYTQLEARREIQAKRRTVWELYLEQLGDWATEEGVRLPVVPPGCEPAYHLFHLVLPTPDDRTQFIAHLAEGGIQASWHYMPLHSSPMGAALGSDPLSCPVTESVAARLVRLPCRTNLEPDEQLLVIDRVRSWHRATYS